MKPVLRTLPVILLVCGLLGLSNYVTPKPLATLPAPELSGTSALPASSSATATANQVEGPVTGQLPDKINLRMEKIYSSPANKEQVTLSFCTPGYENVSNYVNGGYTSSQIGICRTPDRKLHLAGKRVRQGIVLSPEMEGVWRWSGDYSLSFTPKHAWPVGQKYDVTLTASPFPEMVELTQRSESFITADFYPNISSMQFFQDPNELEKRGMMTKINFNMPVSLESLKAHLLFTLDEISTDANITKRHVIEAQKGLPFEVALDESGTVASITTPITQLPDQPRFLRATILPGLEAKIGGKAFDGKGSGLYEERAEVPSRFNYARINSVRTSIVRNSQMKPEQMLLVETNVPVSAEELKKHLTLRLLPKDKKALVVKKDYSWSSSSEVTDEVLQEAVPVQYTFLPMANPFSTLHAIKLDEPENRWLYAVISKGVQFKGDYELESEYAVTTQAPAYPREVKIMGEGALLALNGEKKISLFALGVDSLQFTIKQVMPESVNHLVSQTNGDFAHPYFSGYAFNEDNISEKFERKESLPKNDGRTPQFTSFDFAPFLAGNGGKGLFFIDVAGLIKDKEGKEREVANTRQFLLVTDAGIIVKTARDESKDVFVQSISTGKPIAGAMVEVLGLNGRAVLSAKSDAKGHVHLPPLGSLSNEKTPTAYVVRSGTDMAFMPYNRYDRRLDYSKFETDGIAASDNGLKGLLFSDRGIYRPGEETHIAAIVRQNDRAANLKGLPLQLQLSNPRGQLIDKQQVTLDESGLADYHFSTRDSSPTGVYSVRLFLDQDGNAGTEIGSTSVRVEEFLPDTLKITSAFNKKQLKGWLHPDGIKTKVTLEHLYGAPAIDHRLKAGLTVTPGQFIFRDYSNYRFFDANPAKKEFDQPIGEAQTDDKGSAEFDMNLSAYGDSTYQLTFYAEGFVQGSGRSVKTAKTALVSSLPFIVGVKSDDTLNFIDKDSPRYLKLIAVDPELQQIAAQGLQARITKVTYVSSLIKNERGAYEYRSLPREEEVSRVSFTLPAEGLDYELDTTKAGSYVLHIADAKGRELQNVPYTIVGEGNLPGAVRKDANLTVRLDKSEYQPGDIMRLNLVTPYTGAGLITLETDKVVAFQWFFANSNSSVQEIEIPHDFTGKGFVNVQFLRALTDKEIYTQPLAYSVTPFYVGTQKVDSGIELKLSENIQPGETLSISYRTREDSHIILYGVDEGILQYGHYQMPDPIGYFIGKRALQVSTAQILDLLMPEYSMYAAAFGGDGALADGKNLNPFKRKTLPPVAFWSGIIPSSSEWQQIEYKVPDHFNGNLRVMAIAASDTLLGAKQTRSFVKGDIIVSPNAPTFAAPKDEFTVGLSVANNIKDSGKNAKLALKITPSEHLEVLEAPASLVVPEGGEAKAAIRVRAKDIPGGASLDVAASLGEHASHSEATLSVRPPLPSMTALKSGYVEKGTKDVAQDRALYPQFAEGSASLSTLPLSLIPGLEQYLERFPYGCMEQTVSKAMPAVILYGNPEFALDTKLIEASVENAMSRLSEMQHNNGSFGYWGYGGIDDDFVSVYVLHYLVLAKEKHLAVPDDLFRNSQNYAKQVASRMPYSLTQARTQAYAIYLLTRSGEVTANYLPNLLEYLDQNYKSEWHSDLTAVYIASSYRMMQMVPEANELMKQFALGDAVLWQKNPHYYWEHDNPFYNSLNRYSVYLALLSQHFREMLPEMDRNVLFRIANFIGEGSYNTLSSNYAIWGLVNYGNASAESAKNSLSIAQDGKMLALTGHQVMRGNFAPDKSNLHFAGDGKLGLFYQIVTTGFEKDIPAKPIEDGLEIDHAYLNAEGEKVQEVALGDELTVAITLRTHGDEALQNIAVVDLLPAGFEIVPDSLKQSTSTDEEESDTERWQPQTTDVREDRLIAFGAVPTEEVQYRYRIKAVNKGTYMTPPAYAESMYALDIKARGIAGHLVIK